MFPHDNAICFLVVMVKTVCYVTYLLLLIGVVAKRELAELVQFKPLYGTSVELGCNVMYHLYSTGLLYFYPEVQDKQCLIEVEPAIIFRYLVTLIRLRVIICVYLQNPFMSCYQCYALHDICVGLAIISIEPCVIIMTIITTLFVCPGSGSLAFCVAGQFYYFRYLSRPQRYKIYMFKEF